MLRGQTAPLRFSPRASLRQWRWCLRFLAACRRSVNRRNAAHLLRLALHSQQVLRSWREEDRLDGFAWRANGKLVIYRDRASSPEALRRWMSGPVNGCWMRLNVWRSNLHWRH